MYTNFDHQTLQNVRCNLLTTPCSIFVEIFKKHPMDSKYAPVVSNIVCIDLLNASWEDIQNYCLISNAANGLQMYLKHLHQTLHTNIKDRFQPHLVYVENDFIIGSSRYFSDLTEFVLGGVEILPDSSVNKIDKSIFTEIERELFSNNDLGFTNSLYRKFNNHFSGLIQSHKYITNFMDAHVEVSGGFKLKFDAFCAKFNLSITFLSCQNEPPTQDFVLHKIYFKNKLPIVVVFQNPEGLEFMGWNRHFLLALQAIRPVDTRFLDRKATVNALLDKINAAGIESLNERELGFLDSLSN